jgi:hypothetical protein
MPVIVRNPVAAALAALLVVSVAVLGFLGIEGWADGEGQGDRRVLEIRAESASLIAADVAQFEERRRREGEGYAAGETLLADWLGQFPRDERGRMLEWTRYHSLRTDTRPGGFTVRTSSGPGASGFFRIEVDREAGTVSATCGGDPAPRCTNGRWRVEQHGLPRGYLLGN